MTLTILEYPIERPKMIVKSQIVNQSMLLFKQRLDRFGGKLQEAVGLKWPSVQLNEPRICSPSPSGQTQSRDSQRAQSVIVGVLVVLYPHKKRQIENFNELPDQVV